MHSDRAVCAVWRGHQPELAAFLGLGKTLLLITRRHTALIGFDPDLQKMRRLALGVVELAVRHASARAHALDVAGGNAFDVAHAVFVRQFA
jgi:hypothetical protein